MVENPSIRAKAHMNLRAFHRRSQILDARRRGIHFEAAAFLRRGQGLARRVRRRIGSDDFHGVASVRQQAGVEGIGFVGQIVFQQQPAGFAVAAIVNRINQLIVILVVRTPFHADGIAIVRARHRRFKMTARGATHIGAQAEARRLRQRLVARRPSAPTTSSISGATFFGR